MITKECTFSETEVGDLWDFLITGETDCIGEHGTIISLGQKLDPDAALSVLFELYEMDAIKDRWELCTRCGHLHNADYGGAWAELDAICSDYHFYPEVIEKGGWYCEYCAGFREIPYDERPEDWREELSNTERILTWFTFMNTDQQAERDTTNEYFLITYPDDHARLWLETA